MSKPAPYLATKIAMALAAVRVVPGSFAFRSLSCARFVLMMSPLAASALPSAGFPSSVFCFNLVSVSSVLRTAAIAAILQLLINPTVIKAISSSTDSCLCGT